MTDYDLDVGWLNIEFERMRDRLERIEERLARIESRLPAPGHGPLTEAEAANMAGLTCEEWERQMAGQGDGQR